MSSLELPATIEGIPNVDEYWKRANELGARIVIPLADRCYGLRDFTITDPDGFGIRFASLLPVKRAVIE